ncbi:7347_t:CDS:2 [Entrophospora sp. SA101]|nr:7347_t:CDS:2 [Entrophospora sp. SA101]
MPTEEGILNSIGGEDVIVNLVKDIFVEDEFESEHNSENNYFHDYYEVNETDRNNYSEQECYDININNSLTNDDNNSQKLGKNIIYVAHPNLTLTKELFLKKRINNFDEEQSGLEPDPINIYHPECVAKIGWYINQTNNKNKQKQDSKKNFDEPIVMDDCNNDIQESIDEDQIVNELYNEFQNDSTFLIDDVYTVDNGEDEVPKLTEIFNFELVEKSLKDGKIT